MTKQSKYRVIRHEDGSRTINGKRISACWVDLPDTHVSVAEPKDSDVSFSEINVAYGTTSQEIRFALLDLYFDTGAKFVVSGFHNNTDGIIRRGRGTSLCVNKEIVSSVANRLAERGERRAERGLRGIKAVTAVAKGKMLRNESLESIVFTAERVLHLVPLVNSAFEELARQVKMLATSQQKKRKSR